MDEDLQHVNPCPPDWLSAEQKEKLRGDNIDGTAYNQRWILSSLMAVWNALHDLLPSLQKETNLVRYDVTPLQSSQPVTTNGMPAPETPLLTPQHAAADATPSWPEDEQPCGNASPRQDVVELPEDVERCVCELWDMCVNKHVARHVLMQGDQLVLHMLAFALRDPTAPRLTETLSGLVYNICHQDEGCKAVLQNELLVHLLVSLPERCNDSSVLVQAFNLLHRLVYYVNRLQRAEPKTNSSDTKHTTGDNEVEMVDKTNRESLGVVGSDCSSSTDSITATGRASQTIHGEINGRPDSISATGQATSSKNDSISATGQATSSKNDSISATGQVTCGRIDGRPDSISATGQATCIKNDVRPDSVSTELNNRNNGGPATTDDPASAHSLADSAATSESEESSKLMGSVLRNCNIQHFLAFILHHSLHSELVATTVRLLEELLFFRDPETGSYMADHYAQAGLVPGLLRLVSEWHRQQKQAQQHQQEADFEDDFDSECPVLTSRLEDEHKKVSPVVHNAFICLYAFVDTKAADFLVSSKSGQASLEPALVFYISELVASIETQLRLMKNQPPPLTPYDDCDASLSLRLMAEKLGCSLRLLGLLKRSLSLPEVILGLARLLALLEHSGIAWEDAVDKYTKIDGSAQQETDVFEDVCGNSNGFQSDMSNNPNGFQSGMSNTPNGFQSDMSNNPNGFQSDTSNNPNGFQSDTSNNPNGFQSGMSNNFNGFQSCMSSSSNQGMEPKSSNPNKVVNFLDLDVMAVDNSCSAADERKARERELRKKQHQEYQRQMRLRSGTRSRRRSSLHFDDVTHIQDSEEISVSDGTLAELRDLRRCLEIYFASTLHYWFTFGDLKDKRGVLCSILVVLEQCHMHEVLLVLDALKKFEAGLVAKIQETLLDHQAYPRMVALLAQLYQ